MGTPKESILVRGCAKGFNIDLGVLKKQKLENPWFNVITLGPRETNLNE
jgi:hypothetical protein